jgi:hypothetical protein
MQQQQYGTELSSKMLHQAWDTYREENHNSPRNLASRHGSKTVVGL